MEFQLPGAAIGTAPSAAVVPSLRYHLIEFTREGLAEMDGRRRAVFLRRGEVRSIALRYGYTAERPLLQLALGSTLLVGALLATMFALGMLRRGGWGLRLLAGPVLLGPLGVYVLKQALRRGYYLEVELLRERRKLAVGAAADTGELAGFLGEVERCYGFQVARPAALPAVAAASG